MPIASPQSIVMVAIALIAAVTLTLVIVRGFRAEACAQRLMRHVLSDEEWNGLTGGGYVEVRSPSASYRMYRIPWGAGRVRMYEYGDLVCELCVQPSKPLPASDLVVLHKLMIEGAETQYLATANRFPALDLAPEMKSD